MYDRNSTCRTCLQTGSDLEDLFSEAKHPKFDEMLLSSAQIHVDPKDGLPGKICNKCSDKLYNSYMFKKMCYESECILKGIPRTEDKDNIDTNIAIVKVECASNEYESDGNRDYEDDYFKNDFRETKQALAERSTRKKSSTNCSKCCKGFSNLMELKNHYCDKVRFNCDLCTKTYSSETRLERHVKKIHKSDKLDENGAMCNIMTGVLQIDFTEKNEEVLKIKEEPFINDKENRGKDTLHFDEDDSKFVELLNIEVNEPTKRRPYKRKKTKMGSSKKKDYRRMDIPRHKCKQCPADFHTNIHLVNHMAKEHGVGKHMFGCSVCHKLFPTKKLSHYHRKRAHSDVSKKFICHYCEEQFNSREQITRHLKVLHTTLPMFKCKKCYKKRFYTQQELDEHMATGEHVTRIPKFFCSICNTGFLRKFILERHINRMHTENNVLTTKCFECMKTFSTRWELKAHAKLHETKAAHLCPVCGTAFTILQSLRIHLKRHKGEKIHKCQYCDKKFVRTWDRKMHERHHTDDKPHLCNTCGKGFTTAWHLTVHIRTHTGEKPFKCTYCDWSCAQNNDLKLHIRRHTGERFNCDMCNESFLQLFLLKNHKLAAHGILDPKCVGRIKKVQRAQNDASETKVNSSM